ncbi:hypothetical protein SAMN05421837_1021006 [Amycolatopsis pretoriensis]|uniref:Secreted protein n=1 Tax=Amycolatopsis pretoriensis TaxID=218821 RepID=A0A1H5QG73_9PSEU|nr:hypothetical protein SAMN05421837_1021006 [Amycolatopsis pretoriensis]
MHVWPVAASTPATTPLAAAAASATARPVAVEPVNATLISSASPSVETGECSDGLTTTVHPAAGADASFQVSRSSGEFHGVMAATTPTGSWRAWTR